MPKILCTRFPGKLPTCYGLVSDTANKLATSRCNGIWEMTQHNRHNGLLPAPTCYGFATGKLHGVMDFGLLQGEQVDTDVVSKIIALCPRENFSRQGLISPKKYFDSARKKLLI